MTLEEQFDWWERQAFRDDCPCSGEIHGFIHSMRALRDLVRLGEKTMYGEAGARELFVKGLADLYAGAER